MQDKAKRHHDIVQHQVDKQERLARCWGAYIQGAGKGDQRACAPKVLKNDEFSADEEASKMIFTTKIHQEISKNLKDFPHYVLNLFRL